MRNSHEQEKATNGAGFEPGAILFDLDGTLADTMPIHYRAWIPILDRYGLSMSQERFLSLGGWPTQQVAEMLVAECGRDSDARRIGREKELQFVDLIGHARPIETVLNVARQHRGRIPLAVATGAERRTCEGILRQLGILDWFDAIVCAEDVARPKPDPDIFLHAASRLGVPPEKCLVYEDADAGIQAARAAGMQSIDVRQLPAPRPLP